MPKSKGRRKPKRRAPPPPPPQKEQAPPSAWYVVAMITLLGVGALLVVLNAFELLPGATHDGYLWGGLAAVAVGSVITLNYKEDPSPTWYVGMMFTLIAAGGLIIILNYLDVLPGRGGNQLLFIGLGGIGVGFLMTLNYH